MAVKSPKQLARHSRLKKVALWTTVGLVSYELFMALVIRRQNRRDVFNAAVAQANATQKQLVVVGNPDGGIVNSMVGRDYDCGALCIDERGCPKCKVQAVAQLAQVLPTLPDNSAVIFVSGTLEYVDNLPQILAQLQRVSGGDLFVSHVPAYTMTAFFYPGARRRILQAPPDNATFRWKALPWRTPDPITSFTLQPSTSPVNKLPSYS